MTSNPFFLYGKNILITGASSGIGQACAVKCSELGAKVILMGRDKTRLSKTYSKVYGEGHLCFAIDLTDFEGVEETVKQIVKETGKIDGLINSAGISTTLPITQLKPDKIEHFFRTNVAGAMNLTRLVTAGANFSEEGGSIIFISSVMGVAGEKGKSIYSITKGALIAGAKSLALELASRKIRVNCVSPGVVETPMSKKAIYSRNEESLNKIKALHPLGLGQPEDIANVCAFLMSDAARWITGTNLIVDGGYLAR